jgi:GT2 family glycosyltransferase
MQVSIVIVNFNTFELTSNCIRSIYDKVSGLDVEIILVDNASHERNPDDFINIFPEIILIKSEQNLGFAKGNNLGIAQAKGEYILLLNSDCELLNNAPMLSYNYMKENKSCGLSTVQLQYPNGKLQYNCRRFRTISWELLEVVPLYLLLPKMKREELMLHHYFNHQRQIACDWVWGAYMFFPSKLLQQLPGVKLAEDFFMYCEDTLWCWQIKQLGYTINFLPEAKVMHIHKGSSSSKNKSHFQQMGIKNHAIFMRKIYPDWRWYVFNLIYKSKQALIALIKK